MGRASEIYIVATTGGPKGQDLERTVMGQEFATIDVALTERVLRLEAWPDGTWELREMKGKRWVQADRVPSEQWVLLHRGGVV